MGGAADIASKADAVFLYIFVLTAAFLIFITALMIYFAVKYRRSKGGRAEDIEGHAGLEALWTLIPLALFLSMFYFGWTNYKAMRDVPDDALVVKTVGRQWAWDFIYPNGKRTTELYAAVGRPMKLELESVDVIHGFFIPAFRVKQDVVPGKRNYTWFTPQKLGAFDIECTVICGVKHSYMLSRVHVIPEEEFRAWYFSAGDDPPASVSRGEEALALASAEGRAEGTGDPSAGQALFRDRGCAVCHTTDGSPHIGPSMKGLFGSSVAVLEAGKERVVAADEAYIRRAILQPSAEIRKGFREEMAAETLSEGELSDLLAYIRSLR